MDDADKPDDEEAAPEAPEAPAEPEGDELVAVTPEVTDGAKPTAGAPLLEYEKTL